MSFADMLTPTTPVPTAADAVAMAASAGAAVFTTEEISMIQEMFLSATAGGLEPLKIVLDDAALMSDKDFQISDISVSDGGLLFKADDLMLGTGCAHDDATSVLLSPIGSDETFLNQFLFDEKDAMAAFYTEAIDPFQTSTPSSPVIKTENAIEKGVTTATSPIERPSTDSEKALQKLRNKVEALTKMYYTRCHRLNGGSEDSAVDVEKVKLVHTIEKLQRISEGLAKANAQLVKETTSVTQQRAELLNQMSDDLNDAAVIETIVASINDQACAEAIERATKSIVEFSIDAEESEVMGWKHKSALGTDNPSLTYVFEKRCASMDISEVLRKTWACLSSSEKFTHIVGGPVKVRVVKKVNANAVVLLYDVTSKDSKRVDRILSLMYRVELPNNRYLLGSCPIHPTSLPASSNKDVQWLNHSMWQMHEKKSESEHWVRIGGHNVYPSREEARVMAVEHIRSVLMWENLVLGPVFRL